MGKTFENLTEEQLCDLMCGDAEQEEDMYQCFHCCQMTVVWNSDFTFEEMGYDGEGVVHICRCSNCGAEIEYRVPGAIDEEED